MAYLEFLGGPEDGRRIPLPTDGQIDFGRHSKNTAAIFSDPTISRQHAALAYRQENDSFWLFDLESKLGTWLNGERLTGRDAPRPLSEGDIITLGHTRLIFCA